MIVKIKNNSGGFLVVDNVQDFDYQKKVVKEGKKTQVGEQIYPLENPNNLEREIFIGGCSIYTEVYFRNESRLFRIRTDRSIYLMNDEGKTIERIN